MKNLGAFLADESGSAAVKCGVFAAGSSVSVLMAIEEIGPKSTAYFFSIAEAAPGTVTLGL